MSALFDSMFGLVARGGASLTFPGPAQFAAGASGVALGTLVAPAVFTTFSRVAGSTKIACSAGGVLTTNAATNAGDVLTARFRAATADGSRAIEETFTVTGAAGGAAPTGGVADFTDPSEGGLAALVFGDETA